MYWVSSSLKDMRALPEDVQDVFGQALLDVQFGDTPVGARRFGEGLRAEVWKLASVHEGDSYRAAYTAHFPGAIYVLDVFVKKSKSGIGTPRAVLARVMSRFLIAEKHYRDRNS
jgi:phage-related protein